MLIFMVACLEIYSFLWTITIKEITSIFAIYSHAIIMNSLHQIALQLTGSTTDSIYTRIQFQLQTIRYFIIFDGLCNPQINKSSNNKQQLFLMTAFFSWIFMWKSNSMVSSWRSILNIFCIKISQCPRINRKCLPTYYNIYWNSNSFCTQKHFCHDTNIPFKMVQFVVSPMNMLVYIQNYMAIRG